MIDTPHRSSTGWLGAAGSVLGRSVLAVAGVVFFISALLAGLVATLFVIVWALLTGRRPSIVRFVGNDWRMRARRDGDAGGAAARGEVIDVEVREVRGPESRRD